MRRIKHRKKEEKGGGRKMTGGAREKERRGKQPEWGGEKEGLKAN